MLIKCFHCIDTAGSLLSLKKSKLMAMIEGQSTSGPSTAAAPATGDMDDEFAAFQVSQSGY